MILDRTLANTAALAALALGVLGAACGGGSAPPPPVATAAPAPATGDRPLSSRDAGAPATGAAPVDASAPLPPGHPPVGTPDPHGNVPGAPGAPVRSAGSITGTITLSPKLQVSPTDVLYLMAKKDAATLAVRRIDKPTFPYAFELSGGDAMMAGGSFEGPVDVVARVSRTGDAIPARGDLEGTAKGVAVPSKDVRLTIDSVRP